MDWGYYFVYKSLDYVTLTKGYIRLYFVGIILLYIRFLYYKTIFL